MNVTVPCDHYKVSETPSVDGEHITLDLMAELRLQVTQLLLEDGQC